MPDDTSRRPRPGARSLYELALALRPIAAEIDAAAARQSTPQGRVDVEHVARDLRACTRTLLRCRGGEPPRPGAESPRRRSNRAAAKAERAAPRASPPTSEAPVRVLVVDDDPAHRELACRQLETSPGIRALGVPGAIGLRTAIRQVQPDVVLLDVHLPAISGPEALRLARGTSSTTRFILYSATDEGALRKLAKDFQADGWVTKTEEAARLVAYVRKIAAMRVR